MLTFCKRLCSELEQEEIYKYPELRTWGEEREAKTVVGGWFFPPPI